MKTLGITLFALFAFFTMNAQEVVKTQVPQSYTVGLLKIYPEATDIVWERNNDNYKVEFKVGELERTVHFNKNGDTVRVEAEIVEAKIPVALAEAIKKDYSDYVIDSVHSITKNGTTTYEVILQNKDWVEEISLRYSDSGEVLGMNKY